MNLKEAFKIIKKDAETDDVIIIIGNHLATEQVFQSEEEAQKANMSFTENIKHRAVVDSYKN